MDVYRQAHALLTREMGTPTTPSAYEEALSRIQGSLRGLADFADQMGRHDDYTAILEAYLDVTVTVWAGIRTACPFPAQAVGAES